MLTHVPPSTNSACVVNRLVLFAHVADVEASLRFYALMGFVPQNTMRDAQGSAFWSLLQSGKGELMLARADGPVNAAEQAVLFYMYSPDVAGLRRLLLDQGVHDGGDFHGKAGPNGGRCEAFNLTHPDYMPAGEMRLHDPDGYVILVGQLA